jgi:hypothetical protein
MVPSAMRQCARRGCGHQVKKPTNKYCSRECCQIDPDRIERLKEVSRRRILPMSKQMEMPYWAADETALADACDGVEEAPAGLRRLAAV